MSTITSLRALSIAHIIGLPLCYAVIFAKREIQTYCTYKPETGNSKQVVIKKRFYMASENKRKTGVKNKQPLSLMLLADHMISAFVPVSLSD